MKKLESSLKNMLLVLTGVTAISVALLAYVNELTKEPIAQANAKTLSDAVSAVVPGFDNDPIAEKKTQEVNGVEYSVYPATKEGKFIGAAVEAAAMGFGGELKVLVGGSGRPWRKTTCSGRNFPGTCAWPTSRNTSRSTAGGKTNFRPAS